MYQSMKTRIIRKTTYASKGPEVTLRNIWGREGFDVWCNSWETESKLQMCNFDPITSESRNWSNEELQGREVHAKESHKDNSLSEKAAKKIHEDSLQTPTLISKEYDGEVCTLNEEYDGKVVQTLSRNWK